MRLIDADELKQQFVDKLIRVGLPSEKAEEFAKTAFDAIFKTIDATPTIEAEPVKHGRWIKERVHNLHNGEKRNARECSECGAIYFVYDMANAIDEVPRYCPNCGAKMDLDEVEE